MNGTDVVSALLCVCTAPSLSAQRDALTQLALAFGRVHEDEAETAILELLWSVSVEEKRHGN